MSMQQPIPPEQQPVQVDAPTEGMAAPVEQPMVQPVADGTTPGMVDQQAQAPEVQDQQVIEEIAQGLAEEEITAADIMTAVLSETLGLTPQGAQSLFQLLMSELVDDVQEDTAPVVEDNQPPAEPMI